MYKYVHGLEDTLSKNVVLSKLIYIFNIILVKVPVRFLVNIDKLILKFIWKGIIHRIAKNTLEKEE